MAGRRAVRPRRAATLTTAPPDQRIVLPFLKWAGGKRWFCENHLDLIPEYGGRYIEPFLGSAAVFFALRPERALLTDLNAELIVTYRAMRDTPQAVQELLADFHERHDKDHYYATRAEKPASPIELAAWFIYLNRTCWNGLYRVNLKNEFNVPIGTKTEVVLGTDDFQQLSTILAGAEIRQSDFEQTLDLAGEDDFVFVDPPYTVKHNLNGFVKYNDRIFSWSDQLRLRDAVQRASERGAKVMVLNANHESVREIYANVGAQAALSRASVLAGNPAYRAKVEELMICSWLPGSHFNGHDGLPVGGNAEVAAGAGDNARE